jgi:hypothetical protein
MFILIDAFQPEGVTRMFQDSVFMMPHLGVLSTVHKEAAWNIFDKDCLVRLGTVIAPAGSANLGEPAMTVEFDMPSGQAVKEELNFGEIKRLDLAEGAEAKVAITPHKGLDMGLGPGHRVEKTVMGGTVGLILDARGRPLRIPDDITARRDLLVRWFKALDLYSADKLQELV